MRRRIFIVDDADDSRDFLTEMLVRRGYEVAGMADARTAEPMAKAADLILAVSIPSDPAWLRLLVRLERDRPDLPMLTLLGEAPSPGQERLLSSLECDSLISTIERLLGQSIAPFKAACR